MKGTMLDFIHNIHIKRVQGNAKRVTVEVTPQVYVGATLRLALGWPHRKEAEVPAAIDKPGQR